jgi:hypothetical protein
MTDRRLTDQAITGWLQRGSQAAPAELLADLLEQVAETPQQAGWRLARFWPSAPAVPVGIVGAALTGVLAIGLVAGRLLAPQGGPAGSAPPVASGAPRMSTASPTATVGATPVPFDRPFGYRIDPASGMTLDVSPNIYLFRTTSQADPGFHPTGVNVRALPEIKTGDFCSPGGTTTRFPTPTQVVDAIRSMPLLDVSPVTHTRVDGRDALVITVVQHTGPACPDLYLFPGTVAFTGGASQGSVRRFFFVDVDGETIAVVTFADRARDLPTWIPVADTFIRTIRFAAPAASARNP